MIFCAVRSFVYCFFIVYIIFFTSEERLSTDGFTKIFLTSPSDCTVSSNDFYPINWFTNLDGSAVGVDVVSVRFGMLAGILVTLVEVDDLLVEVEGPLVEVEVDVDVGVGVDGPLVDVDGPLVGTDIPIIEVAGPLTTVDVVLVTLDLDV